MNALLRILAWSIAVALVALPVVAVVQGWIGAERWPLRTLRVTGALERVSDDALRAAVLPYARQGFFAVDLAGAQDAVSRMAWVERAEVRKRWPDVLEVRISEHRPFARWGEDRLLSDRGRLFPAAGVGPQPQLPRFDGPEARIADVVALYNESRALFGPTGHDVGRLAIDTRGSWTMTLSSGTEVIVGSQQARPRLERFARLLPRLVHERAGQRLARADLRYTNGFALTWEEEQGPGAGGQGPGSEPATSPPPRSAAAPGSVPAASLASQRPTSLRPLAPGLRPLEPASSVATYRPFSAAALAPQRPASPWPLAPGPWPLELLRT